MEFKTLYLRKKKELIEDDSLNAINRVFIAQFLEFEEYKLKRKNQLAEVDERSYKTLYFYITRLRNLNSWFENKDWRNLTYEDIKKLIDDLEDGKIVTKRNKKRFSDRSLYYQMMQGKLFRLIGKDNIANEILKENEITGRVNLNQVRYIDESDFRKIVDCAITPEQRCLLWLAFDIGENINSLLALEKKDFQRQINESTKEPEYLVILSKDKLKRSRTARSEITNSQDTVKYLDIVLAGLKDTDKVISNRYMKDKKLSELHHKDKLFKFSHSFALTFLNRAVSKVNVRCKPLGEKVTWKDLRSSMACDMLRKGWTREEINARLGHTPSSRMIDVYITFFAMDRNKPKQKMHESNLNKLKEELDITKETSKLYALRSEKQIREMEEMKTQMESMQNQLADIVAGKKMIIHHDGMGVGYSILNAPKNLRVIEKEIETKAF